MAIEIETDSIRGMGTGKGKIRVRINDEESMRSVRNNLSKAGVTANESVKEAKKNREMTSTEFG